MEMGRWIRHLGEDFSDFPMAHLLRNPRNFAPGLAGKFFLQSIGEWCINNCKLMGLLKKRAVSPAFFLKYDSHLP